MPRSVFAEERRRMVRRQLADRGITDRRVLAAMRAVPREEFVPPDLIHDAYGDYPLRIGAGQTISQPYIVALMTEAAQLTRHSRVLEIGTGSGYHAAVLAHLAGAVWTVDRLPDLARRARERLAALEVPNVTVLIGDGAHGYPPAAPYDAILVAAAAPGPPAALLRQLAPGGRLVIPVGGRDVQQLMVYEQTARGTVTRDLCACCFVPLVSREAFAPTP
jgi:protein-L-isoaspartate(D-aspartate) O-methyltransferase